MSTKILLALHFIVGVNALGGGCYGLLGAPHVPLEWLNGSPFNNYFVPSLLLIILVGGSQLIAAFFIASKRLHADKVSMIAGAILFFWITAQVLIIGFVSWLQPVMAGTAVAIMVLARLIWNIRK